MTAEVADLIVVCAFAQADLFACRGAQEGVFDLHHSRAVEQRSTWLTAQQEGSFVGDGYGKSQRGECELNQLLELAVEVGGVVDDVVPLVGLPRGQGCGVQFASALG